MIAFCRQGLWLSLGIEIEDSLAENTDGDPTGAPKEWLRRLSEKFQGNFSANMRGGATTTKRGDAITRFKIMACLMKIALMENPHPHPELVFSVVGLQHVAPLWQSMDEHMLEKLRSMTYFSEFNDITLLVFHMYFEKSVLVLALFLDIVRKYEKYDVII